MSCCWRDLLIQVGSSWGGPTGLALLYRPSFSGTSRLDLEFSFHENYWHVGGIVSHNLDLTKKITYQIKLWPPSVEFLGVTR